MKYSDGTPIKASDFAYAIQRLFKADSGGSVFFDVIDGATEYADGKAQNISGIKTDDNTGDITITLKEPNGTFENVLGLMFAAPVPPSTPSGQGLDQQAATGQRSVHDQLGQRAAHADDGAQPQLPDRQGRRRQRGSRRERRQDHRQREQEQQRAGDRHRAEQGRLHARSAGRRPPGRGQGEVQRSVPDGGLDQHLLLLHEHGEGAVQRHQGASGHQLRHRPRGAQPDLRWPAASDRSRSCLPACPATRSTSSTPDRT